MDINERIEQLRLGLDDKLNDIQQRNDSIAGRYGLNNYANAIETGVGGTCGEATFCPECGSRNPAASCFCANCGTRLDAENDEADSLVGSYVLPSTPPLMPGDAQYGILYTDTKKLAAKYRCEQKNVFEVLDKFIGNAARFDMHWHLIDAAEHYGSFNDNEFWLEHNELISRCMEERNIAYGIKTPLFLIGGHDVIPIPMVEDVFGSSDEGFIPCDMCYCFIGNFFSDLWEYGDHSITEKSVRNTVSRLPLEDGELESTLEDDLDSYFEHCRLFYEDGIQGNSVMMTANASWLPASRTMSEHLPLLYHSDEPELVQDGMYVSPPVSADDDSAGPLLQTLESVDMLMFNLHGADRHDMPGFYNDCGEAFSIDMLNETTARVFNTVACYGARYHGYERYESMMLTSLYEDGFLLYAGSLIPVPMMDLNVPDGVEVHEGSGSEHLMPIFCMEQFSGVPMGEALMRAKLNYFNVFRHFERDDFSMATMMMFSLYGNPMLHMRRNEEVIRRAKEENVLPVLPQSKDIPVRMKRTKRVIDKKQTALSLLEQIRNCVDNNIAAIHKTVEENLYRSLGLEPRWLSHVDSFSIPNGDGTFEEGYCYTYNDSSKPYARNSWVEVDRNGNVKRVVRTK